MIGLNRDQIIKLHEAKYERYGGDVSVLNDGMLDSALQAPFQTFGGEELIPDTKEKILTIARSHCLCNRTEFDMLSILKYSRNSMCLRDI